MLNLRESALVREIPCSIPENDPKRLFLQLKLHPGTAGMLTMLSIVFSKSNQVKQFTWQAINIQLFDTPSNWWIHPSKSRQKRCPCQLLSEFLHLFGIHSLKGIHGYCFCFFLILGLHPLEKISISFFCLEGESQFNAWVFPNLVEIGCFWKWFASMTIVESKSAPEQVLQSTGSPVLPTQEGFLQTSWKVLFKYISRKHAPNKNRLQWNEDSFNFPKGSIGSKYYQVYT